MNLNIFHRPSDHVAAKSDTSNVVDEVGELVVYGTAWCGDCHRSRRFLDRHGIPYRWIDVDRDPVSITRVLEINHGKRSVPTIIFPDGSTLTEPSNVELAAKLGIVG